MSENQTHSDSLPDETPQEPVTTVCEDPQIASQQSAPVERTAEQSTIVLPDSERRRSLRARVRHVAGGREDHEPTRGGHHRSRMVASLLLAIVLCVAVALGASVITRHPGRARGSSQQEIADAPCAAHAGRSKARERRSRLRIAAASTRTPSARTHSRSAPYRRAQVMPATQAAPATVPAPVPAPASSEPVPAGAPSAPVRQAASSPAQAQGGGGPFSP